MEAMKSRYSLDGTRGKCSARETDCRFLPANPYFALTVVDLKENRTGHHGHNETSLIAWTKVKHSN